MDQPDYTETESYGPEWFEAKPVVLPKYPPCCLNCVYGFQGNHGDEPTDCEHFGYLRKLIKCNLWKARHNYEEV